MTTATKSSVKEYIHYIITALIIFGFPLLPNIGTITDEGMVILGAFIGAIYGWSFIDMLWPSILAIFSMGLELGVGTVVAAGLGNQVTWMLIFLYIIIGILTDAKIIDVIIGFFLTRKLFVKYPVLLMGTVLFVNLLCSMFNGFGAEVIFLALIFEMCRMFDIKPFSKFPVVFGIGIALTSAVAAIMLPFQGTAVLMLSAWTGITGETLNYATYMATAFPIAIFMIVIFLLIARFVLRVDFSVLQGFDAEKLGISNKKLNGEQKLAVVMLVWMILNLMLPSFLPAEWSLTKFLNNLTVFGQVALPIVFFMVVKYQGKRVINFEDIAKRYIPWQIFLMMGVIMPLSSFLTADSTGIKEFMTGLTEPLLSLGTFGFLIIMMVSTVILTNFANNAVVGMIMMPVIYAFSLSNNALSTSAAVMILIFCTHFAFLTPGATPYAAIMFGNTKWIKAKLVYKYGIIIIVLLFICTLPVAYFWSNLM
ncbi:MAG: anion permease [Peptococcaceae bacterium]|nr:anion permease [Peptococcaceae bacterium]